MNIMEGNTVAHTFSLRFRNRIVWPEAEALCSGKTEILSTSSAALRPESPHSLQRWGKEYPPISSLNIAAPCRVMEQSYTTVGPGYPPDWQVSSVFMESWWPSKAVTGFSEMMLVSRHPLGNLRNPCENSWEPSETHSEKNLAKNWVVSVSRWELGANKT